MLYRVKYTIFSETLGPVLSFAFASIVQSEYYHLWPSTQVGHISGIFNALVTNEVYAAELCRWIYKINHHGSEGVEKLNVTNSHAWKHENRLIISWIELEGNFREFYIQLNKSEDPAWRRSEKRNKKFGWIHLSSAHVALSKKSWILSTRELFAMVYIIWIFMFLRESTLERL